MGLFLFYLASAINDVISFVETSGAGNISPHLKVRKLSRHACTNSAPELVEGLPN